MKAESEKGTCCVEVKFAHLLKEILLVRKLIWQFPRAHHDRHDSHAPHVPGEVVDVVCHYFRGHVQRSAHDLRPSVFGVGEVEGGAKVDQLQFNG